MRRPGWDGWRAAVEAGRVNLGPAVVLWGVGMAMVGAYYGWPAARAVMDEVAGVKQRYGVGYAMVSTALFGAVIPTLVQQCRPAWRAGAPLVHLPYLLAYWAVSGAVVDGLYRGQAWLFGAGHHWTTVGAKVAVDQLIFTPLWAVPYMVIGYQFKDSGYSVRRTRAALGRGWYRRRGWPILLANWGLWVPVVACVYMLPLGLQVPVQNLALCLWSLMLLWLTGPGRPTTREACLETGSIRAGRDRPGDRPASS